MAEQTSEIAALLGSRICHDLISPIGAISNGVELLALSGASRMPEIDLIAQSVEHANARIAFFRVAFGGASDGQEVSAAEIRQILDNLTRGSRLEIVWTDEDSVPRSEAKLAFLVLNCLESALPRGGTVTVSRNGQAWKVVAEAARLNVEPDLWEALSNPGTRARASAADVQFLLAPLVAHDIGRSLTAELGATSATVWF